MERDIFFTSSLFALLAGLWYLNRPWDPHPSLIPTFWRHLLNLLGGLLVLLLTGIWVWQINRAPYQPIIRPGTRQLNLSEREFGTQWPLRPPSGVLECLSNQQIVFHTQGKTYGVNGAAKLNQYPPLEKIARRDRYIPSARQDLSLFQSIGLKLCQ
jgi:hypothetical protein